MEVHAHTHTPRKKWTHYFWEFLKQKCRGVASVFILTTGFNLLQRWMTETESHRLGTFVLIYVVPMALSIWHCSFQRTEVRFFKMFRAYGSCRS